MQMIGWEHAAIVVQIVHAWLIRLLARKHVRLRRHEPAFLQIAWRAGRNDIFPGCLSSGAAGNDMVKCQIVRLTAILALEPVAQKHIKPCESRMTARLDIVFEADDAWKLHCKRRRRNLSVVFGNNVHTIKKNRLDCILPRPKRQGVIAQRSVIRVEHEGRKGIGRYRDRQESPRGDNCHVS